MGTDGAAGDSLSTKLNYWSQDEFMKSKHYI